MPKPSLASPAYLVQPFQESLVGMPPTLGAEKRQYTWYCCSCSDGPLSTSNHAACVICREQHELCNQCVIEATPNLAQISEAQPLTVERVRRSDLLESREIHETVPVFLSEVTQNDERYHKSSSAVVTQKHTTVPLSSLSIDETGDSDSDSGSDCDSDFGSLISYDSKDDSESGDWRHGPREAVHTEINTEGDYRAPRPCDSTDPDQTRVRGFPSQHVSHAPVSHSSTRGNRDTTVVRLENKLQQNSRSQTRGRSKRKRQDSDEEENEGQQSASHSLKRQSEPGARWLCPYYKDNPFRHVACEDSEFRDLSRVRLVRASRSSSLGMHSPNGTGST